MLTLLRVDPVVLRAVAESLRSTAKVDPVVPEKLADEGYRYRVAYEHGRASVVADLEDIIKRMQEPE